MTSQDYWTEYNIGTYWTTTKTIGTPKEKIYTQEPLLNERYDAPNLDQEVVKSTHLSTKEKQKLRTVLTENKAIIQGTKGTRIGKPIVLKLKNESNSLYERPC